MDTSNRIIKKIVALAEMKALSPFIVGTGKKQENIDLPILRDNENNPYIPATSFSGSVRSFLENGVFDHKNNLIKNFFGYTQQNEALQSAIKVFDLNLIDKSNYSIAKRTGIRIDPKTNIAMDKMKMEYELVEPGASFQLEMELTIRDNPEENDLIKLFFTILGLLRDGKIHFGAFNTKGFGRFKAENIKYRVYDFNSTDDGLDWILRNDQYAIHEELGEKWKKEIDNNQILSIQYPDYIKINAYFSLTNSLLIKHYSTDFSSADTVHIHSKGIPVIPGSSLKGVLRHRAEKICHYLFQDRSSEFTNWCFGNISDKLSNKNSLSHIVTEEKQVVQENIAMEIQNRIQIDRFTGGTTNTTLFDAVPLWKKNDQKAVNLEFSIYNQDNSTNFEAGVGLLLLLLKDFWTEDLPLGGEKSIGRGIVKGLEANITLCRNGSEKHIKLSNEKDRLNISSHDFPNPAETLQTYVDKLIAWNGKDGA